MACGHFVVHRRTYCRDKALNTLRSLLAAVCGVGDQLVGLAVHNEIQRFERHHSQETGNAFRHFDHVKVLLLPHQFDLHRLGLEPDCAPIGGLRTNRIHPLQAQFPDYRGFSSNLAEQWGHGYIEALEQA